MVLLLDAKRQSRGNCKKHRRFPRLSQDLAIYQAFRKCRLPGKDPDREITFAGATPISPPRATLPHSFSLVTRCLTLNGLPDGLPDLGRHDSPPCPESSSWRTRC